jgi:hypothetical protein
VTTIAAALAAQLARTVDRGGTRHARANPAPGKTSACQYHQGARHAPVGSTGRRTTDSAGANAAVRLQLAQHRGGAVGGLIGQHRGRATCAAAATPWMVSRVVRHSPWDWCTSAYRMPLRQTTQQILQMPLVPPRWGA